jgi:hypothetical protein
MEVTGLLKVKGEIETLTKKDGSAVIGKNGVMQKMMFVIHQAGQYGKDLCLETFSAPVMQFLADTKLDTELTCKVDLESREYQGRYYTSIKCFSLTADKTENYENKRAFNEPPVGNIGAGYVDDGNNLPF